MEKKDNKIPVDGYDLSALAEAMLMVEKRLPDGLPEDLCTLRQMLEDAVSGGNCDGGPVPPAYGKVMIPCMGEKDTEVHTVLRQDENVPFPTMLTTLSPRQAEEYVAVPQVVGQGGNT